MKPVVEDLKRTQLLTNILTSSSLLEAFKKSEISPPTGYRYLADPTFQAELKEANQKIYSTTLARLSGLSETAYEALAELLKSKNDNVRAKAVSTYFGMMMNPKSTVNDGEAAERKEHIDKMYAAIKQLPKDAQKAFLDAYEHTG